MHSSETNARMRNLKLALAVCAALSFAAACNNAPGPSNQTATANAGAAATQTPAPTLPAATPDEFAQVRGVYSGVCARCHKQDGTGGPAELDDGKTLKVPSLREHGRKDSDAHLAKQIREGGDGMPAFKTRLSEEQITELVRFVRKEFHGRDTTPAANANAASTPAGERR